MSNKVSAGGRVIGRAGGFPLVDGDLEQIHAGALDVLERTGVWVEMDDAIDVFDDGGCHVARESRVVRIPPQIVEQALRDTPGEVALYDVTSTKVTTLGSDGVTFTTFAEGIMTNDLVTGLNRPSTLQDIADAARICDWASELDVLTLPVGARDYPDFPEAHGMAAALKNTTKPLACSAADRADLQTCIELCAIVAGGKDALRERPFFAAAIGSTAPLQLTRACTDPLLLSAREGLPLALTTTVMSGATGPQTLAGALVLHLAETLAMTTLFQLAERGGKAMWTSCTMPMDLRFAVPASGAPEAALLSACAAQLGRRCGVASVTNGLWTDSKVADAQAAHEKTLNALASAMAGPNMVFGAGQLESGFTLDLGQLLIDNDIAAMIRQYVGGVAVSEETLALEEIHAVGPKGMFLSRDHTVRHMREGSRPHLLNREGRERWQDEGAMDLATRANAEARRILAEHQPDPLPAEIVAAIDRLLARIESGAGAV
jgi:trimethylamine--corrinoid protein Co-methyltransferase